MDISLDEVIHFDAISSASTGAAADADSTPTFAVYEEATDTDIGVGGNMTKRTSLTGNYRGSFTASAANGFELGKWYNVIGSATIGGIACKGVLKTFRIIVAEVVAGYPPADTLKVGGTTQTARDIGASVLLSSGTGTGQIKIASGYVAPNWGDVGNPTTTLSLTNTTVATVTTTGTATAVTTVNGLAANVITETSIANNAITDAKVASDVTIASVTGAVGSVTGAVGSVTGAVGSVTGAVGSVTGAVGSVTGNVGGNVVGSVASVTGNVGGNVVGSVASVTGNVGGNVVGSVASVTAGVTVTTNNDKTGYALSAAGVDAIWDEAQSGHSTAGTFGKYLDDEISQVSGGGGGAAGEGSEEWVITIKDGSNNPLDGVAVWVTTDSAGTNVVAGTLHTDALGVVTFMLDTGDYYRWAQRSGINFTNPSSFTVS